MKLDPTAAATVDARVLRLVMKLREQGIADTGVLAALERVPREAFVLDSFADRAYDNKALPIDQGQTISQPYIVAYMSEALRLDDRHKVLEVGTGSGYQTAILSKLCRRVYTIERYPSLLAQAEARFEELGLYNITSRLGDGHLRLARAGAVPAHHRHRGRRRGARDPDRPARRRRCHGRSRRRRPAQPAPRPPDAGRGGGRKRGADPGALRSAGRRDRGRAVTRRPCASTPGSLG